MSDTPRSCRIQHIPSRTTLYATLVLILSTGLLFGQQPAQAFQTQATQTQLESIATQLAVTESHLEESQREIHQLQQQIAALRSQLASLSPGTQSPVPESSSAAPPSLDEKVAVLESQVEQHDQTKLESLSKYPVRVTGLVLFNTFTNSGAVDNFDQPAIAVVLPPDTPSRAFGGTMRQSILGIQANGPHVLGGRSSAEVNLDFYGGTQYTNYGSTGGLVRLRTGAVRLSWERDTAEVGLVEPLISPLSPTSYASVAEPPMAWAGNLWTWAPQLSYQHLFQASGNGRFGWQFGLWDPPAAGYTNADIFRVPSSGERSGQPAYETRFSFQRSEASEPGRLQVGLGGYYSRQSYTGRSGDSWAVTGDWKIPLGHIFELSGEAYRGRALGGLGAGLYKDIINGTDPVTGKSTFRLLNDAGGWTQAKVRFTRLFEANGAFGLDNGFARDFHSLILPPTASATQLRARNQMVTANLIYTPKTYLILSPEYRHIHTASINSTASTADIFTLSLGYRF